MDDSARTTAGRGNQESQGGMTEPDFPDAEVGWKEEFRFHLLALLGRLDGWREKHQDQPYKLLELERWCACLVEMGPMADTGLSVLEDLYDHHSKVMWEVSFTHDSGLEELAGLVATALRAAQAQEELDPLPKLRKAEERTTYVEMYQTLQDQPEIVARLLGIMSRAGQEGIRFRKAGEHYLHPMLEYVSSQAQLFSHKEWVHTMMTVGAARVLGEKMRRVARQEDINRHLPWLAEQHPEAVVGLLTAEEQNTGQHTEVPENLLQQLLAHDHRSVREAAFRALGKREAGAESISQPRRDGP